MKEYIIAVIIIIVQVVVVIAGLNHLLNSII